MNDAESADMEEDDGGDDGGEGDDGQKNECEEGHCEEPEESALELMVIYHVFIIKMTVSVRLPRAEEKTTQTYLIFNLIYTCFI